MKMSGGRTFHEIQQTFDAKKLRFILQTPEWIFGLHISAVVLLVSKDGIYLIKDLSKIFESWYEIFGNIFHNSKTVNMQTI